MSDSNGNGKQSPRDKRYADFATAMEGEKLFVRDVFSAVDPIIADKFNEVAWRVLEWIKRHSWGRLCLYCIAEDGTVLLQADCARDLELSKGTISKTVKYLCLRGYIRVEGKMLYPVLSPKPDPPEKVSQRETFSEFLDYLKVSQQETFQAFKAAKQSVEAARQASKVAQREAKPIEQVVRCEYQRWRRAKRKDAHPIETLQTSLDSDSERTNEHSPELPEAPVPELVRPSVSPPTIREQLEPWLTDRMDEFGLLTPPDARILDRISSQLPNTVVFERFKAQIEKQKPSPQNWAYFETLAIVCEKGQALSDAKFARLQAEHEARQLQLASWRNAEPDEPFREPEPEISPPPVPVPKLDNEAEQSRRNTLTIQRAARKAEAEENRKRYAKPPGTEHGLKIELPNVKGASG